MGNNSDADLVRQALAGERVAFEALVARYWERLYVLATHSKLVGSGPEDVVQEAFIQACRKLASLREPARFGSWLYTIALRICARRRAGRTGAMVPLSEGTPSANRHADPAAAGEASETRERVRAAVASLADDYRVVVTLRFFDGMSCEQIAEHLALPVGTVWTRLHRANGILRRKLGYLAPEGRGGKR